MAVGAVILAVAFGVIGWLVRQDQTARLTPVMRESIWLSFLATALLTLLIGYVVGGTRHIGSHLEGGPTFPLFGWSGVVGDLRPAHFLGLHAMQAIPLLGLWLARRGRFEATQTIRITTAAYSVVTLAIFGQAMMGWPFIPLG